MYRVVDNISCHLHTLDAVCRVLSWRLLLPPTNYAIRAARLGPLHIRLFRADTQVFEASDMPPLIESFCF